MDISVTITQMRDRYLAEGQARHAYYINDGLCENFAADVIEAFAGSETDDHFMVGGENFMTEDDEWDWKLLKKHWKIQRPEAFTADEFDSIPFGHHIFIVSDRRFYDAECPNGVDNFFELPLYRRSIVHALQQKSIALNDHDNALLQDTQEILEEHPPRKRGRRRLDADNSPSP